VKQCLPAVFPCFGHAQWCGVCWGSCGFYSVALRSTHSHVRLCCSTVLSDFAPCPPSLSGKYELIIMVPLFLQCDSAWWLLLTGLSWLPYAFGYCALLSFQAPSPSSSIVDEFKYLLIHDKSKKHNCLF